MNPWASPSPSIQATMPDPCCDRESYFIESIGKYCAALVERQSPMSGEQTVRGSCKNLIEGLIFMLLGGSWTHAAVSIVSDVKVNFQIEIGEYRGSSLQIYAQVAGQRPTTTINQRRQRVQPRAPPSPEASSVPVLATAQHFSLLPAADVVSSPERQIILVLSSSFFVHGVAIMRRASRRSVPTT